MISAAKSSQNRHHYSLEPDRSAHCISGQDSHPTPHPALQLTVLRVATIVIHIPMYVAFRFVEFCESFTLWSMSSFTPRTAHELALRDYRPAGAKEKEPGLIILDSFRRVILVHERYRVAVFADGVLPVVRVRFHLLLPDALGTDPALEPIAVAQLVQKLALYVLFHFGIAWIAESHDIPTGQWALEMWPSLPVTCLAEPAGASPTFFADVDAAFSARQCARFVAFAGEKTHLDLLVTVDLSTSRGPSIGFSSFRSQFKRSLDAVTKSLPVTDAAPF
ncbi:hypothetical protein GGR57DRAFT_476318 [Xylariaceae sp. FL1272]|nr:hypothetical protein GGR57DRAFT_476318 [Xylariaceae sp. FL1272]